MWRGKGSFEARPADGLRLIATTESIQHLDPGIFPFVVWPATTPVLRRLQGLPRLAGPAHREQPACDLGGDLWHLPNRFIILRSVGIDIALGVGDLLQCPPDSADATAFGD